MKSLIYAGICTGASVLALSASAPAFAQATTPVPCVGAAGNCSVVDVAGSGNTTSVDQSAGTGNVSGVVQDGENLDVTVTQGADGNISTVDQSTVGVTPIDTTAIVNQVNGGDSIIS